MQYRKEIDGLRALAVLPVLLYHAGVPGFQGGYVGVDVFFVISGYLITSVLNGEIEKGGEFSFRRFYERRARRLLPALFSVALVSSIAAWFVLLPNEMKDFSQSLVAISAFASNLHFFRKTGYFESATELKPLMHTWSLAIEEQFYFLFPACLLLCRRMPRLYWALGLVGIASLLHSQFNGPLHPSANFYLLPYRGWELLLGVFLSLAGQSFSARTPLPHWLTNLGEGLGLALIIFSIAAFDHTTAFPSFFALVPTVGTLFILGFTSSNSPLGRILGSRPLVAIGLMSYSIYLWHQPLFAFFKIRYDSVLPSLLQWTLIGLSLICGALSWRFIERPFREKGLFSQKEIFQYSIFGMILLTAIGLAGHFSHGMSFRPSFGKLPKNYLSYLSPLPQDNTGIDLNACVSEAASLCKRADFSDSTKTFLLAGDSHSGDFGPLFKAYLQTYHYNGYQLSIGGCAFLTNQTKDIHSECYQAKEVVAQVIQKIPNLNWILIGNYYGHTENLSTKERSFVLQSFVSWIKTILKLGVHIHFFSPRFELSRNPAQAAFLGILDLVNVSISVQNSSEWNQAIASLELDPSFSVFDQNKALLQLDCGRRECFSGHTPQGIPIYRDSNHLTRWGAEQVFQAFAKQLPHATPSQ